MISFVRRTVFLKAIKPGFRLGLNNFLLVSEFMIITHTLSHERDIQRIARIADLYMGSFWTNDRLSNYLILKRLINFLDKSRAISQTLFPLLLIFFLSFGLIIPGVGFVYIRPNKCILLPKVKGNWIISNKSQLI
jgi:hypothetical protein